MASSNSLQQFTYSDKEIDTFLKNLNQVNVDSSYYLTILSGSNRSARGSFMNKLKSATGSELQVIDLSEVITSVEEESYRNIDNLIDSLGSEKIVWFSHGDDLDGEYTAFSSSVRRYATPQEKYLLNKIKGTEKIYFFEFNDETAVTNMLRRHAQTLITFPMPDTLFGRLKQITVHGSSFNSKRRAVV